MKKNEMQKSGLTKTETMIWAIAFTMLLMGFLMGFSVLLATFFERPATQKANESCGFQWICHREAGGTNWVLKPLDIVEDTSDQELK